MQIKQSPLELIDLAIVNFQYGANPAEIDRDVQELFASYEVDMDFAVTMGETEIIRILVKVSINRPADNKAQPGYMLFAEAMGLFRFRETQADKMQPLVNSGLTMTISYLRTFLAGVTSHFPLGKYWIPSVDLNEMILLKSQAKVAAADKKTTHKRAKGK